VVLPTVRYRRSKGRLQEDTVVKNGKSLTEIIAGNVLLHFFITTVMYKYEELYYHPLLLITETKKDNISENKTP